MYPVLFTIGNFELSSWGVAFVISVIVGLEVSLKRASRFGVKPNTVLDMSIFITIAAIVGSRFWYVVGHINKSNGYWFDIIHLFRGGDLSMIGGIVLSIPVALVYVRMKKQSFVALDVIAPTFLLGAGIQRLGGCFLSGCCFGRPTNSFLGVVFSKGAASSRFPGIPLWPTQIFASILGFTGFALALWIGRKHCFPGYTLWQVFAYYSVERFLVDQFRYYEPSQVLGQFGSFIININHPVLAGLFVLSSVLWLRGWLRRGGGARPGDCESYQGAI